MTAPSVLAEQYLRHLSIERGLAKNSLLAYRRDLNLYLNFLQRNDLDDIAQVSELAIESFVQELGATKKATSVARTLAAVRGWHRYLMLESIVANDTSHEVKPPKAAQRLPKAISIAQVEQILDAAGPDPMADIDYQVDQMRLRDRALLELLYATGARVSELIRLDLDDLVDPTLVRLFGKGSKERIVPVGRYARAALDQYLVRARVSLVAKGKGAPAVFLNHHGNRLSRQSVWQIITDAADAAQLGVEVSPHTFRHSFATHLLEGGADVRVVQELLGHASVATTQIYTLVTVDTLREQYQLAHPRARE
ncbi:MAG: hypothetical protein RL556_833 [Actinomycetota bacterium]|jgi:integrase/recombinase XerD